MNKPASIRITIDFPLSRSPHFRQALALAAKIPPVWESGPEGTHFYSVTRAIVRWPS